MKVKLHFNRINMQRKDPRVWSAHTAKSCNMSQEVEIWAFGSKIGKAVFHSDKKNNPRAWIEFEGTVGVEETSGKTSIFCGTIKRQ